MRQALGDSAVVPVGRLLHHRSAGAGLVHRLQEVLLQGRAGGDIAQRRRQILRQPHLVARRALRHAELAPVGGDLLRRGIGARLHHRAAETSEEHPPAPQALKRISYAVICFKKKPHSTTLLSYSSTTYSTHN